MTYSRYYKLIDVVRIAMLEQEEENEPITIEIHCESNRVVVSVKPHNSTELIEYWIPNNITNKLEEDISELVCNDFEATVTSFLLQAIAQYNKIFIPNEAQLELA